MEAKKQIKIRSEHYTYNKDTSDTVSKLNELIALAMYEYYKKNKGKKN